MDNMESGTELPVVLAFLPAHESMTIDCTSESPAGSAALASQALVFEMVQVAATSESGVPPCPLTFSLQQRRPFEIEVCNN